jgi:hypothetical protein
MNLQIPVIQEITKSTQARDNTVAFSAISNYNSEQNEASLKKYNPFRS